MNYDLSVNNFGYICPKSYKSKHRRKQKQIEQGKVPTKVRNKNPSKKPRKLRYITPLNQDVRPICLGATNLAI